MSSVQSSSRLPGLGFIFAGALLLVGGQLHPRADISLEFDAAVAGMLVDSTCTVSHAVTLVGVLVAGAALILFLRNGSLSSQRGVQLLDIVAFGSTVLHSIEMVPHILQNLEAEAVLSGGSTPIKDVHLVVQAITNPVFGLGFASLAAVGAKARALGHWLIAPLAVVGGISFAIAGPAVLIIRQPEFSLFFIGSIGIALWLVVAGIRAAWRPQLRYAH